MLVYSLLSWFQTVVLNLVRVLYSYESNGPDELSIAEGEEIELTTGPEGGQNYADGWWEAVKEGRKGIFPSNYVRLMLFQEQLRTWD